MKDEEAREMIGASKDLINAVNQTIIQTRFLRDPKLNVEIKTAKQAMAHSVKGLKNKVPLDVIKAQLRMSKFGQKVSDPQQMADLCVKGANRKVAYEQYGHLVEQNHQRDLGQNRGFGR